MKFKRFQGWFPPYLSIVVAELLSCVQLFATPWTLACQASLSITVSLSLLKLMSIESGMPSNHLILCCLLLLLPSIFPSIRIFSNKSTLLIRRPKYWSFGFIFIFTGVQFAHVESTHLKCPALCTHFYMCGHHVTTPRSRCRRCPSPRGLPQPPPSQQPRRDLHLDLYHH